MAIVLLTAENTFTESAIITDEVIDNIRQVSASQRHYIITPISAVLNQRSSLFPGVPQVAVFDTSFHQTLAPEALPLRPAAGLLPAIGRAYAMVSTAPRTVTWLSARMALLGLPEQDSGLVVAHLGNGASICAVRNGHSVDTSMGMTPLEGLMMGTRSGDVDFGAMAWIAGETNQTLGDLERVVNKESGLLGISGLVVRPAGAGKSLA